MAATAKNPDREVCRFRDNEHSIECCAPADVRVVDVSTGHRCQLCLAHFAWVRLEGDGAWIETARLDSPHR